MEQEGTEAIMHEGSGEGAGAPIDAVERLASMSQAEVDDLPYGFVVLDAEGTILLYNRYEARMARMAPERVIGRNFFHHVAPCTRVAAFHGRFRAFVEGASPATARFAFRFHFLHGAQDVIVQFVRAPAADGEGAARVFMTVARRVLHPADESPEEVRLDADRGAAAGPLGPTLPLDGAAVGELLDRAGAAAASAIGRRYGELLAAAAEASVRRAGGGSLADAPPQLLAGALDEVLARAGLGRLALDLTPRPATSVLGCLLRPPVRVLSSALAAFYEGLLGAALGAAQGVPAIARCLDLRDLGALPWRFAVAPTALAGALDPLPGEGPDDVARRLGLLSGDDPV